MLSNRVLESDLVPSASMIERKNLLISKREFEFKGLKVTELVVKWPTVAYKHADDEVGEEVLGCKIMWARTPIDKTVVDGTPNPLAHTGFVPGTGWPDETKTKEDEGRERVQAEFERYYRSVGLIKD